MSLTLISDLLNEVTKMDFKQETITIPKEEYEAIMSKYNELMARNVTETIVDNLTAYEDEGLWFYANELADLNKKKIDCFDGQMLVVLRFDPQKFILEGGELYERNTGCGTSEAPAMYGDGAYFITSVNSRATEGYVNPKSTNSAYITVCKFLKL